MRTVSVLLADSPDGPVGAVQDHFGSAYRCLPSPMSAGEVYESIHKLASLIHVDNMKLRCVVIARVDPALVRALVRKTNNPAWPLQRGYWYEVRGE